MEQQSTHQDGNVMGVVRCTQVKHARRNFLNYKKRFWVVDESQSRLEMYKNDQETFPQAKLTASELRGVFFSGDRQNKFYGLALQLRGGGSIKFRFNSIEERDRWYAAITRVIERYSAYSHDKNVMRVAQRRALTAERSFGVGITLTVTQLSSFPEKLLQYLVEAVDAAIAIVATVIHTYGSDVELPRRFNITVLAMDAHEHRGPQYDPTTRSLVLFVLIYRDILGHVRFAVPDATEIIAMTQSHVWRDPLIEGWITSNPSCVAVCREIADFLGLKRNFTFTFRWGQNLRDLDSIEKYLAAYVHEEFLREVPRQLTAIVDELRSENADVDVSVYIKYIRDYVQSIAIMLDEQAVNAGRAPEMSVTTTPEYQRRCRSAVFATAKYIESFPPSHKGTASSQSLREQLVEIIFLADFSKKMSDSKATLRQALGGKLYVRVLWDSLLRACSRVDAPLHLRKLQQLVVDFTNIYLGRLESLKQLITGMESPNDDEVPLFAIFKNVLSITVDFIPFTGDRAPLPDLRFTHGVLTDVFLCANDSSRRTLIDCIKRERSLQMDSKKAYTLLESTCVFPSYPVAAFRDWCEESLNTPTGSEMVANDRSDDSSSWSSTPDELGDAVALERSAETQVLNIHRVVNMIYDSQGASVSLKIGADAIYEAINALEGAFDGRRIRKHDLARVLIANLRRLRTLYNYVVGGEVVGAPNLEGALGLLHEFCEYEMSETDIPDLLRQAAEARRLSSIQRSGVYAAESSTTPSLAASQPTASRSAPTTTDGTYDFPCVSQVALNHLLPREAKLARLAWRVGLVAGLDNVGKTLILNSMKGFVQSTVPTVGLAQRVVAFEEWVFAMHELGGRESFRENWRYYVARMEEVSFLMFVVDAMNRRSHKDAGAYLRDIAKHFGSAPLLLVYNNYRPNSRGTPSLAELASALKLQKIERRHPNRRIFVGTCDVTVVSSSHRILQPSLMSALLEVSAHLRRVSSSNVHAALPKAGGGNEAALRLSSSIVMSR